MSAKLRLVLASVTVEPMLVCFILPSVMAALATQNLNLDKACRVNLAMEPGTCDALAARNASGYDRAEEVAVQRLAATMNAWKNVVQSCVPCVLLLFLGSWSDRRRRRKPCFLAPILGEALACTGLLLCTVFYEELSVEFNVVFEAVPPSLTGGWFAMFMAVFSYVAEMTSERTRTLRIGAVNLCVNLSFTVGNALSGVLYKHVGFFGIYSLAVLFYVVGFVYGLVAVKEIADGEERQVRGEKSFLRDFFDTKHVAETFRVAFKKGEGNRRAKICTIMVLCVVIVGPMHGEMSVLYLFLRYKFGWNEVDYSIYSTFYVITHMLGTLFSLVIFTKILKVDDALLGLVSSTSRILASLVYAFAPNSFTFYVGALIEVLNGTTFIAMRSIMSKLVPPNELGKINSLFGLAEATVPIIYGPLYSAIYKLTIDSLPGAFFIVGAVLTVPSLFIFCWLYKGHKRDEEDARQLTDYNKIQLNPFKIIGAGTSPVGLPHAAPELGVLHLRQDVRHSLHQDPREAVSEEVARRERAAAAGHQGPGAGEEGTFCRSAAEDRSRARTEAGEDALTQEGPDVPVLHLREAVHGQLDLHPRAAVPQDVEDRKRQAAAAQEEASAAQAGHQVHAGRQNRLRGDERCEVAEPSQSIGAMSVLFEDLQSGQGGGAREELQGELIDDSFTRCVDVM